MNATPEPMNDYVQSARARSAALRFFEALDRITARDRQDFRLSLRVDPSGAFTVTLCAFGPDTVAGAEILRRAHYQGRLHGAVFVQYPKEPGWAGGGQCFGWGFGVPPEQVTK